MLFQLILCGLIATLMMSLTLYAINSAGIANGDMHRAIGSLFTRSIHNSFALGTFIHFLVGVCLTFAYYLVVSASPVSTADYRVIYVCLAASFFHGLVVSILLVITVAEHHPLEHFRTVGPKVAITHFFAHLVYGFSLGVLFYFLIPAARPIMN